MLLVGASLTRFGLTNLAWKTVWVGRRPVGTLPRTGDSVYGARHDATIIASSMSSIERLYMRAPRPTNRENAIINNHTTRAETVTFNVHLQGARNIPDAVYTIYTRRTGIYLKTWSIGGGVLLGGFRLNYTINIVLDMCAAHSWPTNWYLFVVQIAINLWHRRMESPSSSHSCI